MERSEIFARLVDAIRRMQPDGRTISEGSLLDYRDLGMTSVQILSLLVTLEEQLSLEVDDTRLDAFQYSTISQLLDCLASAPLRRA